MVYAFEIIGVLFIAMMVYLTYLEYKRKNLDRIGLTFWNLIWAMGAFLILFHNYVNNLLPELNIVRVLDLYMILSFMFLFALVFYLFIIIKRTEKRVEQLTRIIALKPLKEIKKGR
jgi:hypothetical protein